MTITDDKFEDRLRKIIREEVRPIVGEQVHGLREDIKMIQQILGSHSMQLRTLQAGMNTANNTLRGHTTEIHRLDILLEDLNDRLATARELRWD